MTQKIQAVLFDAGNTLVSLDHEILAAAAGLADPEAVRAGDREVRPVISAKFAAGEPIDFGVEYYGGMLLAAGLDKRKLPQAIARLHAAERVFPLWRRANPEARPAIEALKERGIRVAVVSNSDGRVAPLLAAAALADLFEFILDSHLEGLAKPDPAFFLAAAARLGIAPAACAYVGDIPDIDVTGARAAGMLPILYDPLAAWPDWAASARITDLRALSSMV
jgi:putative hydrolase of the HAD superfamily